MSENRKGCHDLKIAYRVKGLLILKLKINYSSVC